MSNRSAIDTVSKEWFFSDTEKTGIFIMIRDGKFDIAMWEKMMGALRQVRSPSDSEVRILARVLWLVPVLMATKLKYFEKRGISTDVIDRCRGQLEHEMSRLLGLP